MVAILEFMSLYLSGTYADYSSAAGLQYEPIRSSGLEVIRKIRTARMAAIMQPFWILSHFS